jgi:hypothetical protein
MYVPSNGHVSMPSAQAQDLGQRIASVVRSYLSDNPGVGATDVLQAFTVARRLLHGELGGVAAQKLAVLLSLAVGALVLGLFVALRLNGGWDPRFPLISVAVIAIAIGGLVIAIARSRI